MTTEDDRNIDDLVDYKDFESNLESNSDQDSFNKDIMKLYEDHKKKGGDKTEVQNSQRPVSKYQRNLVSAGKREEEGRENTLQKENPQNEENNSINNLPEKSETIPSCSDNNLIRGKFISRLNQFINKFKIVRLDFMDNPKIYFTEEEFREIFKKIRFEISHSELNYIFTDNNFAYRDGYILGQTFLENFKNDLKWYDNDDLRKIDSIDNHIYTEYYNLNLTHKKSETEIKRINDEFKILQDEVLQIVAKESRPKSSAKFPKRSLNSAKPNTMIPVNSNSNNNINVISNKSQKNSFDTKARPMSNITYTNTQSRQNNPSKNISVSKIKPQSASYLKETIMKKKAEDEIVRLAIERRNKENDRDCIKKMSEANQISEELGLLKSYSAYTDENEGIIICRVFDKVTKKTNDIYLKKFMMEYKRLVKLLKQKELTKYYKNQQTEETKNDTKENVKDENLLLLGRQQRQKKIKDVLIDSLELKMKLKRQLKALRDKNLVDHSIIRNNLKLINLDDDNII